MARRPPRSPARAGSHGSPQNGHPIRLTTPDLVSAIRARAGISQEELARRMDVSFASVNAWERGRTEPRSVHRDRLDAIARELGVRQALKVLVIDDEPDVCEVVEVLVHRANPDAVVETATSGTDALLVCGSFQPDLVLLDLRMPGLDGLEVAEAMARVEALRDTVLVFVTGTIDGVLRTGAEQVATVATKPLLGRDVAALLALVDDPDARRVGDARTTDHVPATGDARDDGRRP